MTYLYLIIAFLLNGIANLVLKYSSLHEGSFDFSDISLKFIGDHKWLIIGIMLFASNVLVYMLALKNLSVSIAYPIMVAMSLLIVGTGAHFIFKESLTSVQLLGYLLLIIAVYLISAKQSIIQ